MKLETKIDLPQLVATVGVILSLMFVGYEVRQNTQVARAAAVQSTIEQIVEWGTQSASNPEMMRIMAFLNNGGRYAELSATDQALYGWTVGQTVRIMENRFRQMQLGVISAEDIGIGGGTSNPAWFRSRHFLDWWTSIDRTRSWAPDYLEFFETEVLEIR